MDLDSFIESLLKKQKPKKYPHFTYYTEGVKYLSNGLYQTALEFLDNAVENDKTSVKSLLKRSKCFICLREYEKAIKDADQALLLSPGNSDAIDLKGQAQYLHGDFEGGYLTYLNARKKNRINDKFRLGKQLCRSALENTLNAPHKIRADKIDVARVKTPEVDGTSFKSNLRSFSCRRDCFRKDKRFIKELLKNENLTSVHEYCKEAADYIADCERFWATETPFHARKSIPNISYREVRKSERTEKKMAVFKAAIRRAQSELKKGRIDSTISELDKLLESLEYAVNEKEDEKAKLKCEAYHLMGLAYRSAKNIFKSSWYLWKELKIARKSDLLIPQTRAYHILGENYQIQGNIPKALECFNKISEVTDPDRLRVEKEEDLVEGISELESAQDWMNSIVSGVKMSIEESILSPIIDTVEELIERNGVSGKLKEMNIEEKSDSSSVHEIDVISSTEKNLDTENDSYQEASSSE